MHPDWQFDHIDPLLSNPLNEVLADLRAQCPVTHSTKHGGFTAALTYDLIKQILGDHGSYSSAHGIAIPRLTMTGKPPIDYDPPLHTMYRKILQRHFTRAAVAKYDDTLRALVRQRIEDVLARGEGDLVTDLAHYLPPAAIALILGMPPEDGLKFVRWLEVMFVAARTGDPKTGGRAYQEFQEYIAGQLAQQRAAGADTVALAIADGTVDGRPLTSDEQINMFTILIIAGHETTVHGLSSMLYFLATVDGLRARLLNEPALLSKMIDECLRIEAPVVGIARTALRDTEVVSDGEKVVLVLNAANHDPAVFSEPAEFRCERDRNPHLAFGYGVHRCVGEHLALLEMRVVAEEVLSLLPDYRFAADFRPQWIGGRMTRGIESLPVQLR
ncbi:Cytochrome P450 [Lentzea waywayandensis]|uniref:Cytochrome P450 n=1 Tax=Lentzea waywayandensis TaxID=84724 RepID=A0A1I6EQ15_9PSEU|nr:cytochrome P450 [Lentzea waywayandensis]SFR19839.1 Cytochrome P450 [Lentzea waywayandensis]